MNTDDRDMFLDDYAPPPRPEPPPVQYYTNGKTTTTRRPDPLITSRGPVFNPSEATYQRNGWVPCDPPELVPETDPLEGYHKALQDFGILWASTGAPLTDDWSDAIAALKAANVPEATMIELLALRVALSPVWDHVLAMLTPKEDEVEEEV